MNNHRNNVPQTAILIVLVVISAFGAWGLFSRFSHGEISELTNVVPWGLWVSGYIFFIGLSAGAFLISSLIFVFNIHEFEKAGRIALIQAFICLLCAMLLIFVDLGHPFRAMVMFGGFNTTSVMAWMFVGYNLYFLIVAAELFLVTRMDRLDDVGKKRNRKLLKTLGIMGIPSAIFVHGGVGSIFATVKAHPVWATGLLPILFLISALVSGGALLTVLLYLYYRTGNAAEKREKEALVCRVGKLAGAILFAEMLSLISEFLVVLYGGVPHHARVYQLIMTGPFWFLFWVGQVFVGLLIPFFIFLNPRLNRNFKAVAFSCACILVGIVCIRINIVIPTLLIPNFDSLPLAYPHPRYAAFYFPNYKEWFVLLSAFAMGGWLFEIGRRILPLQEPAAADTE